MTPHRWRRRQAVLHAQAVALRHRDDAHLAKPAETAADRLRGGRQIGGDIDLRQWEVRAPSVSGSLSTTEMRKAQIRTSTPLRPTIMPRRKIGSCPAQIEGSNRPCSRQLRMRALCQREREWRT
jgi:hypothetical protein